MASYFREAGRPFLALSLVLLFIFSLMNPTNFMSSTYALINTDLPSNSQDIVDRAAHVIIGRVETVASFWEGGIIVTHVNVSVMNREKGTLPLYSKITIKHVGGNVGNIGFSYSDQPIFVNGESAKLFLQIEKEGLFSVVNGNKGKISVDQPSQSSSLLGYAVDTPPNRWSYSELPVHYSINPTSPSGVNSTDWINAIQNSFQVWEDDPASFIDYDYDSTTLTLGPNPNTGGPRDYLNAVYAKDGFNNPNVLARAYWWYDTSTGPEYYRIVEIDIIFNTAHQWATSGEIGKFDMQSVGAHEVGHTLSLLDLYDIEDYEETMYGYVSAGDTKKRTLNSGDITGVRFLYPDNVFPPTAYIDSISPNPAISGQIVTFSGHGTDSDGSIVAYNWRSGIDGPLSTSSSFNTTLLSVGTHTIYFMVKDDDEAWSAEVTGTLEIKPTLSDASSDIIDASENGMYFIYPDYSGSKPPGVAYALLSDWTAAGFIVGMVSNRQQETTDTNPAIIDMSSGEPRLEGETIVLFGGPIVNAPVNYYEKNRIAPLYWKYEGGNNYWYLANGSRLDVTAMPGSQIAAGTQDMFVLETFIDSSDNKVYMIYGYGWKGTFAGGKFFKFIIYPDIDSYTDSYYVFKWVDEDSDGFVDLDEILTTPIVSG
jgi:hypothetical protein